MHEEPQAAMPASPAGEHAVQRVTALDLFLGFGAAGLLGFGTAMPWARWMIVEKRKWLTEQEMLNILALCQLLPGPNVCNVAVAVGARFAGVAGALAAITGLMLAPVIIVIGLATLYGNFSHLPAVQAAFRGISAAAAGLVMAMGIRFLPPLRNNPRALAFLALALAAVLILNVPLGWIILTLVPASIAAAWALGR
jgi:chromate transporter